jgi:hypothetical protein
MDPDTQTWRSDASGSLPVSRHYHHAAALEPCAAALPTAPVYSSGSFYPGFLEKLSSLSRIGATVDDSGYESFIFGFPQISNYLDDSESTVGIKSLIV